MPHDMPPPPPPPPPSPPPSPHTLPLYSGKAARLREGRAPAGQQLQPLLQQPRPSSPIPLALTSPSTLASPL
ncbi:hypothetical protein E2C01_091570 [Portunus trituberculatus]|uniref:Uncharacterized protein n=1 Tax=Portunus trituberculatus TaxID=210409 RepID=A0A5B7JT93_PORTR|nr:hypothetical protein [Portunus trituberculatus]